MNKTYNFSGQPIKKSSVLVVIILIIFSACVGITLAFFFDADYASNYVGLSGKVNIEAVGAGDKTIEDNEACNLEITLDKTYKKLIPGMPITMPANVKVYQSTTSPLLRAKVEIDFVNPENDQEAEDKLAVVQDMYSQLLTIIETNKWYLHTDGYFYYVGTANTQSQLGGGYITCRS